MKQEQLDELSDLLESLKKLLPEAEENIRQQAMHAPLDTYLSLLGTNVVQLIHDMNEVSKKSGESVIQILLPHPEIKICNVPVLYSRGVKEISFLTKEMEILK